MAQIAQRPDLAYLNAAHPLPVMAEIALRVAYVCAKWDERRRTRRALAKLEPHLLFDIGLTIDEARQEAAKKFWQG